jgi:hypothetical protein
MRYALAFVVFLILISGVAHAQSEIVLVDSVLGLGNYEARSTNIFKPGDTVKVYMEADDVNHRGLVAVNFVVFLYNTYSGHYELWDFQRLRVRYLNYREKDTYAVYEFKIPEDFNPGEYTIKIAAYDVANEENLNEVFAQMQNFFEPDFSKPNTYVNAPQGEDAADAYYGNLGLIKSEDWRTLKFIKTLSFKVVTSPREVEELASKVNFTNKINITATYLGLLNGSHQNGIFKQGGEMAINVTARGINHQGLVALDFIFTIVDKDLLPLAKPETYRVRFKTYKERDFTFTYNFTDKKLEPGEYYLDIKIYDRANPDYIEDVLNALKFTSDFDTSKITTYLNMPEGVNVNDNTYSSIGALKAMDYTTLVFSSKIPFKVIKEEEVPIEVLEELKPEIEVLELETSKYLLKPNEPFRVILTVKNHGGSGRASITVTLSGETREYRLPKDFLFEANETRKVSFEINLPMEEGVWRVGVVNTTIIRPVFVFAGELGKKEEVPEEELEERLKPQKRERNPYPMAILAAVLLPLLILKLVIKGLKIPVSEWTGLGLNFTIAVVLILFAAYAVYYFIL